LEVEIHRDLQRRYSSARWCAVPRQLPETTCRI
jgi:hypothetical protein